MEPIHLQLNAHREMKWKKEHIQYLKDNYHNGNIENISLVIGRTYNEIKSKANYLGLNVNKKNKRRFYFKSKPLRKIALMLEDWVSNPDLSNRELGEKHGFPTNTIANYKNDWFPYRGENSELLTLKSKV